MKGRIVPIISRWPFLYRLTSRLYYVLQPEHLREFFLGTRAGEQRWASRNIATGYWDNREHPSKRFLADKIASFSPVNTVLEVGCASGPNLYLLARKLPQTNITGIDINPAAVEYGNTRLKEEGRANVKLVVGKADALGDFPDRAFDVVFTSALLIYIGPDKIREVIQGMLRVTKRALVLMELHRPEPDSKDLLGLGVYYQGNWVRDYVNLLKQFVAEEQIRVSRIPPDVWPDAPWSELGAIIEVIR